VINQRGDRGPAAGAPKVFKRKLKSKRYVVTAAQNATPIHVAFFNTLRHYAIANDAELIVIPLRYKNPTSRWTESQQNAESWATETLPFLYNARKALNSNVVLLADIKTQPTASSPLTSYEAMSHGESAIIGHTKLQMKVIPTPQHKFPKILTTTGACTVANYTDSKAGKLGEFHHTLGAVIVEVKDSKIFHLRHINGNKDTGEFIDPDVERATFGKGGIVETLKPGTLVWHDLLDAYAVNPHHRGNPFTAIAKRTVGRDNVREEVRRAIKFVVDRTPKAVRSVVVASNHDEFLARWVRDTDWRFDPTNATFYLHTALVLAEQTGLTKHGTQTPSPFSYWLGIWGETNIRALLPSESFALGGVRSIGTLAMPNEVLGLLSGYSFTCGAPI
jgi:hypothetical protein